MTNFKLLAPVKLGDLELRNRLAIAPLTRARASPEGVPTPLMVEYYAQRASAGLFITEATGISRQALGWYCASGIWNDEQVEGWKPIVAAVKAKGGMPAMQLWHMGRQVHSIETDGKGPVAPSPIAMQGPISTREGKKPAEVPRELTVEDIKQIVADYKAAAENAKKAGFDVIEIHSANGYLLDTFLQTSTNKRTDQYGGPIENRVRMLEEVLDAVTTVFPANRVGVRFAPNGVYGEMGSDDNDKTFSEVIRRMGSRKLAYIHVMDGLGFGFHDKCPAFTLRMARDILNTTESKDTTLIMGNVGYTRATAEERIQSGDADMIAFGRLFMSNPDLVERFALNPEGEPPLNDDCDREFWWTAGYGSKGYTDFPTYEEAKAKAN